MFAQLRFGPFLLATTLFFHASSPATAQESWVGEYILPTKPTKEIKFGDVIQDKQVYFPLSGTLELKVRGEREGWLRIHDGQRDGWLEKIDFILVRDAPDYFTRRIQVNPMDHFALYMRGVAWLKKGDADKAIKDFDEYIRLNPTDSAAFTSRGLAWQDKKEFDKAIRDYTETIRLDPKNADTLNNRGVAWNAKKDFEKALRDFDEAIRLNPKYAAAFQNRASAWAAKKDYDKAVKDCDEAIRLEPKNADAYYDKACCLALQGRTEPAIESLGQALELGFHDFDHMARDSDLDSIRGDPRYKELLKKYAK